MGSYLVPSPLPDASATQRGAVSTGAQEIAGAKTFKGDVTIEGTLTAPGVGGVVTSVTAGNGLTLTAGDLAMGAASAAAAGAVTTGDQSLGGAGSTKTFASIIVGTLATLAVAVTNLVRAVGAALVLRSDLGAGASDVAVKVGSSVADGSVNAAAKLLSVRTGLGGTEVEKFYVNKAGGLWSAGGTFLGNDATGNTSLSLGAAGGGFIFNGGVHAFQFNGGFLRFISGSVVAWYVDSSGRVDLRGTDSSGTPGAASISKPTGKSAVASGASSVRITNTLVAAGDQVHVTMHGDCGQRHWVSTGAGYFDVVLSGAATADTAFCWTVAKRL